MSLLVNTHELNLDYSVIEDSERPIHSPSLVVHE